MSEGSTKDKVTPKERVLKHRCTTCLRDIVDESYALCIKCKGFVQCLECLNEGIEKGTHLREHPFIIVEPRIKSIFRADWTAEEEVLFLDAIQTYGLGNYEDIEALIPFKSAADYESHFQSVYLASNLAPKPEQIVMGKDDPVPAPAYPTSPVPSLPSDGNDEILKQKGKKEAETPGEHACFMPMRREFEYEYREQGEELICSMKFDPETDNYATFMKKLERLRAYSSLVEERDLKTNTAIEFDLQNKPFSLPVGQSAEIHEAFQKLLPLSPYLKKNITNDINELVKDNFHFKSLMETRLKWKQNGVRSLNEGFLFQSLEGLVVNGKLTSASQWNKFIDDYQKKTGDTESPEARLLDEQETDLCRAFGIPIQLYLGLKDLILREFTIRGSLSKDQCCDLDPTNSVILGNMYDFFVRNGWVWK